ncbi:hypothetical protein H0E87_021202 [Populus deltoides]|uniref:Non-haem dioxygenase N-terminal domain-containing protein n=1 Tax=Populus deltoides TaxID=3696 RepID=A0A8T2XQL5_POPDE|nr:hypothetical protein H0E87_021202 [Populus deltoides]
MAPTAKLLLADLASSGVKQIPSNYIHPISDRPNLSDVQISDGSIPLIDLHGLNGPSHSTIIEQIGQACQRDGFFQVLKKWQVDGVNPIPNTFIVNIGDQMQVITNLHRRRRSGRRDGRTLRQPDLIFISGGGHADAVVKSRPWDR